MILESKKVKWAFRHADRAGASRVILLAPSEWETKHVRIKDMASGEESEVALDALLS